MDATLTPTPQPERGAEGGTDPGPRNLTLDRQNPDILVPPATNHGTLPNLWFPFSAAHNRLESAGWAREITLLELPSSPTLAGVNMRLNPGQTESGVRELHWHKQSEWAYMLSGTARLMAIDQDGRTFADDVARGDLWYFPAGLPQSIQAHAEGCEFLLVFDDGSFSENDTFLLTDWLAHTPRSVLAKNFGVAEEPLQDMPTKEKYIFPAPLPGPLAEAIPAGWPGAVPFAMGHYIENTGSTTLCFLEVFKSDHFADVSLTQWLALTPPALVKAHLNVGDDFIAQLQKPKSMVVKS